MARKIQLNIYNNARKAGFENINTDLLFDIPGQTMERWEKDLSTLVDLNPEHISTYSLTVEKQTPLFELVKSGIKTKDIGGDVTTTEFTKQITDNL